MSWSGKRPSSMPRGTSQAPKKDEAWQFYLWRKHCRSFYHNITFERIIWRIFSFTILQISQELQVIKIGRWEALRSVLSSFEAQTGFSLPRLIVHIMAIDQRKNNFFGRLFDTLQGAKFQLDPLWNRVRYKFVCDWLRLTWPMIARKRKKNTSSWFVPSLFSIKLT